MDEFGKRDPLFSRRMHTALLNAILRLAGYRRTLNDLDKSIIWFWAVTLNMAFLNLVFYVFVFLYTLHYQYGLYGKFTKELIDNPFYDIYNMITFLFTCGFIAVLGYHNFNLTRLRIMRISKYKTWVIWNVSIALLFSTYQLTFCWYTKRLSLDVVIGLFITLSILMNELFLVFSLLKLVKRRERDYSQKFKNGRTHRTFQLRPQVRIRHLRFDILNDILGFIQRFPIELRVPN